MIKSYLLLLIAIILEVIATSSLKSCEHFTKLIPTIITIVGYLLSIYFLSLILKTIPLGIAYAFWAGLGIVLILLIGIIVFKEIPDLFAIIGLVLIITGVVLIHLFSKTSRY
ncbi:MAG: multidrug efflux SMR transporter [Methanobrevibacter sp.]|jgi:small multidrug resistance pump|nr:multidrug efflux SMR transporter [Methanobrevibacter sp.]